MQRIGMLFCLILGLTACTITRSFYVAEDERPGFGISDQAVNLRGYYPIAKLNSRESPQPHTAFIQVQNNSDSAKEFVLTKFDFNGEGAKFDKEIQKSFGLHKKIILEPLTAYRELEVVYLISLENKEVIMSLEYQINGENYVKSVLLKHKIETEPTFGE